MTVADWRGLTTQPANLDVAVDGDADTFLDRFIERVGGLAASRLRRGTLGRRRRPAIRSTWLRVAIGAAAAVAAVVVGISRGRRLRRRRAEPGRLPPGADLFMLVLAISLLVGFVAYAVVEWLQTRRLDSIARQFGTRTIVLMPIAIAINIVLGQTVATR